MQFEHLVAVVLAGNDENASLLGGIGQSTKFLMPFGDERMADRILRAIDGMRCCESIYVAVPPGFAQGSTLASRHPLHLVSQGRTRTESLINALDEAQREGDYAEGDYVLVVVADLPLLGPMALERFVAACQEVEEAECYMGMIPWQAVDQRLQPAYERDLLPFRGELYLHSDVYLLQPSSLTEVGRERFERITSIRRSDRKSVRSMVEVAVVLLSIVGFRALLPLIRTIVGLRTGRESHQGQARTALDGVERMALDLIEERFGPKVNLVTIHEPALALDVDREGQLELLVEYAGGRALPSDAVSSAPP